MASNKGINFTFSSEEDANKVLNAMRLIVENFEWVYVSDLNDLIGLKSTYVDAKWGWKTVDSAKVQKTEKGYTIKFPDPELNLSLLEKENDART